MTWADFHRHADAIVEHYTPLIEQAMAELIPAEVIDQVLAEAYRGAAKATQQQQTQPPLTPPAQTAAVTTATAGLPALGATGALLGAGALGLGRALAMLAAVPLKIALLAKVVALLYAAAYLAGANDAAAAADGELPPGTVILPDRGRIPEGWSGGGDSDVLARASGALADLLRGSRHLDQGDVHHPGEPSGRGDTGRHRERPTAL